MKKLLYLTTWDFSDGPSAGITKKIKTQIKVFEKNGFSVDYTCLSDNETVFCKDGTSSRLGKVGRLRKLAGNYYLYKRLKKEKYPYVYNRYGLMDPFYLKLLKALCKNGARIVVEMPTYPYDKERQKGLSWWLLFMVDKLYRMRMKKYVYRIADCSGYDEIFGIPTVRSINGIDFEAVRERKPDDKSEGINLIAVAGIAIWHGYDRFLEGMGEYYQKGGTENIVFHLVGDGEAVKDYKRIVEKYGLEQHVIFYGVKYGEELDEIYDKCDIGLEGLGCHRKNISLSGSLKSREYMAKGLPFITACEMDIMNEEDFVLHVPSDDTPIDISLVLDFYERIYGGYSKQAVADSIRNRAKKKCSIEETMKLVVECFHEL